MSLFEILRQTIATFRAHKLRIFLTMLASCGDLVGDSGGGLGRGFSADQKRRIGLWQGPGDRLGRETSSQVGGLARARGHPDHR